jgi:hypothetical protein
VVPFEKTNPIRHLSFLRKQESTFVNDSGFRIKCGMTIPKKNSYAKQTQFSGVIPSGIPEGAATLQI